MGPQSLLTSGAPAEGDGKAPVVGLESACEADIPKSLSQLPLLPRTANSAPFPAPAPTRSALLLASTLASIASAVCLRPQRDRDSRISMPFAGTMISFGKIALAPMEFDGKDVGDPWLEVGEHKVAVGLVSPAGLVLVVVALE